jgi:hypothetical protein
MSVTLFHDVYPVIASLSTTIHRLFTTKSQLTHSYAFIHKVIHRLSTNKPPPPLETIASLLSASFNQRQIGVGIET